MYRYSQRLSWSTSPNPFSTLVVAARSSGSSLIDLTISNPTEVELDYPHLEIAHSYANLTDLTYQPKPFGALRARESIVRYYSRRNISITPDRLALTASTSEAYSLLFKLFCDPGDEVLVPSPSYPLFDYLAALEAVRLVPYRIRYDGSWFLDFDHLRAQLSPRTRAIVVVNPNNPTGSYLKQSEADALLNLAESHRIPVISDEVFMDYPLDNSSGQVKTLAQFDSALTFSLNGLSKAAGMPQLKLGWIILNGPSYERTIAGERLELLLDTYLSVSNPVQQRLEDLLSTGEAVQRQIARRALDNLSQGREILAGSPAHFLHTEGGWSAIIQLPNTLSEEAWIIRLLCDYSVLVQPGYFFDMPSEAYIVVSLITPPAVFKLGLERLREMLHNC